MTKLEDLLTELDDLRDRVLDAIDAQPSTEPEDDYAWLRIGMWVNHDVHGRVLVIADSSDGGGQAKIFVPADPPSTGVIFTVDVETLSPITLGSFEDYADAWLGVVVQDDDGVRHFKTHNGWYDEHGSYFSDGWMTCKGSLIVLYAPEVDNA